MKCKKCGKQMNVRGWKKNNKSIIYTWRCNCGQERVFVGSSNDLFSFKIAESWINKTLEHCCKYKNKYLFQTKNPERFKFFTSSFPGDSILCTTIETNRAYGSNTSLAPTVYERAKELGEIISHKTMVTIEPIMDFDINDMIEFIEIASPDFINIGAVTGGHDLPEPTREKVQLLRQKMSKYEIFIKDNLKRIVE